ncbi:MAG: methionine--tRNA ligase [Thermoplasmata archaeon]|nr:methionine--tRNA ligase [Thermoplasmata archaeon]
MARILIGVAWPYANGPFHIGHLAGAYLPGDIFARFHRLRGDEVLMVSGSDMHGTPILVTAEREHRTPSEVSEQYHEVNRAAFSRLGFTFDCYTTTRTIVHEKTVQEVFLALLEHGFVSRQTEEGAFCPQHRRFLPDRYLVGTCPNCGFESARGDECDRCGRPLEPRQLGHPRCLLCNTPAEFRPSEHFYLRLDLLQPQLTEYLSRQPHWRAGTRRVAENFLTEGLRPTPITRDLDWGVSIPLDGYPSKRFYVWFDALIGYLSASKEWAIRAGRPEAWRRYWDEGEPVRSYYFIGKDNKFHHSILWPGVLLGHGGLSLPFDVPANEWLLIGGKKPSKSRPTEATAFIPSLLEHFSPDVIRFYSALLAPQNHDTELDWDEVGKVRDEVLANQFGNLVQRSLVLCRDRYSGRVPSPPDSWNGEGAGGVGLRLREAHAQITAEFEAVHLKEALDRTLDEVRGANRSFHEAKPWQLSDPERARVVYETVWTLRALATWLSPVIPFACADTFRMLGFADGPGAGDWDRALEPVPGGQALGEIRPLFPKPESARALGSTAPVVAADTVVVAPPLAVRSGVVLRAAPHPSADRLLVLEVDAGEANPRSIVAGIRANYGPDTLVGRPIVFLSNLAARTIRGVPSQGMVLAADTGERPVLLSPPPGVRPGEFVEGRSASDRTITHAEFMSYGLVVARVLGAPAAGRSVVESRGTPEEVDGDWNEGTQVIVVRRPPDAVGAKVLSFGPGRPVRPSEDIAVGAVVR